jgi:hypothetical protein
MGNVTSSERERKDIERAAFLTATSSYKERSGRTETSGGWPAQAMLQLGMGVVKGEHGGYVEVAIGSVKDKESAGQQDTKGGRGAESVIQPCKRSGECNRGGSCFWVVASCRVSGLGRLRL